MTHDESILRLEAITLAFGALKAVDDVSLTVARGARHALIGPNGAGKSSLFSVVSGTRRATSGRIVFDGNDVTSLSEMKRSRAGLVRTFQHSSVFLGLSVLDNVAMSVEGRAGQPMRPWGGTRRGSVVDEAMQQLADVGLGDRATVTASELSHGERRQLEVGMVLASAPRLVLFDEPTAGMSAADTENFVRLVQELPRSISVVIVEHDLDVVFRLADRISVLSTGALIADGDPDAVKNDPAVQAAYLGTNQSEPLFEEVP